MPRYSAQVPDVLRRMGVPDAAVDRLDSPWTFYRDADGDLHWSKGCYVLRSDAAGTFRSGPLPEGQVTVRLVPSQAAPDVSGCRSCSSLPFVDEPTRSNMWEAVCEFDRLLVGAGRALSVPGQKNPTGLFTKLTGTLRLLEFCADPALHASSLGGLVDAHRPRLENQARRIRDRLLGDDARLVLRHLTALALVEALVTSNNSWGVDALRAAGPYRSSSFHERRWLYVAIAETWARSLSLSPSERALAVEARALRVSLYARTPQERRAYQRVRRSAAQSFARAADEVYERTMSDETMRVVGISSARFPLMVSHQSVEDAAVVSYAVGVDLSRRLPDQLVLLAPAPIVQLLAHPAHAGSRRYVLDLAETTPLPSLEVLEVAATLWSPGLPSSKLCSLSQALAAASSLT